MNEARYITVRNWQRFQHYTDRNPPWIKNYTELLSDEAYLGLSGHRRSILHGLWLEYARSNCRLTDDTRMLTRRLNLKVTTSDLASLNHAGFITFSASKPQARRTKTASPRARGRAVARGIYSSREEQDQNLLPVTAETSPGQNGSHPAAADTHEAPREARIREAIASLRGHDAGSVNRILPLALQVDAHTFEELYNRTTRSTRASNPCGLLYTHLERAVKERKPRLVVAEAPLSAIERMKRDDPEAYVRKMGEHLSQTDLEAYLAKYVTDPDLATHLANLHSTAA